MVSMFPLMGSMICYFLVFFSYVMKPILFVNEFFTTPLTLYNWMMVHMPGMIYLILVIFKLLTALITYIFFAMEKVHCLLSDVSCTIKAVCRSKPLQEACVNIRKIEFPEIHD